MTTTKQELLLELFHSQVSIRDSRFGKSANWENNTHPDYAGEYSETIFWVAFENVEQQHVNFAYFLSQQDRNRRKIVATIELNGRTFEDVVFEYWHNN